MDEMVAENLQESVVRKEREGRLPVWRRLSYGCVGVGGNFAFSMVSSYLTVFYTDVVGLTPAVISIIMPKKAMVHGVLSPFTFNLSPLPILHVI